MRYCNPWTRLIETMAEAVLGRRARSAPSHSVVSDVPTLIDTFLSRAPLVVSSPSNYRNRMVYDLRQGEAALHRCELGLPLVREAGCVVARWVAEQSGMPVGYYREATVRASSIGTLQVKLLVQTALPPAADSRWPQERARLLAYLRQQLPLLRSLPTQCMTVDSACM